MIQTPLSAEKEGFVFNIIHLKVNSYKKSIDIFEDLAFDGRWID